LCRQPVHELGKNLHEIFERYLHGVSMAAPHEEKVNWIRILEMTGFHLELQERVVSQFVRKKRKQQFSKRISRQKYHLSIEERHPFVVDFMVIGI
jgi:hypothetical protein